MGVPVRTEDCGLDWCKWFAVRRNIELFSNTQEAGNFYDIVYTTSGRRYFRQLKNDDSLDKKKLTKGNLVKLLQKCFKFYCDIKHNETLNIYRLLTRGLSFTQTKT